MEDIWQPLWKMQDYDNATSVEFKLEVPCLIKLTGIMIHGYKEVIDNFIENNALIEIFLNDKNIYNLTMHMCEIVQDGVTFLKRRFVIPVTMNKGDIARVFISEIRPIKGKVNNLKMTVTLEGYRKKLLGEK